MRTDSDSSVPARRQHAEDASRRALIGRSRELADIAGALSGSSGCGEAILVRGGPGLGKTALLLAAGEMAADSGWQVVRATGMQGAGDAFAALHSVLHPVLHGLAALPRRQRGAVEIVFGLAEGPAPDMLVVQLGALSLLEEAAATQPIALVVDDAQWLDKASAAVLAFVAQRLSTAPIVVIVGTRIDEDDQFGHIPRQLILKPLDETEARLLLTRSGVSLDVPSRKRVIAQAEGNPLALIELAKSPDTSSASRSGLMPLTMRLRRVFGEQVQALPRPSQLLLLVAAANDGPFLRELAAAGQLMGADIADLAAAEAAGIVRVVEDEIRFRHPLVRAAVYEGANAVDRVRAHQALAAALTHAPDRAALQRASATLLPDDEVAGELERCAHRQDSRGAAISAAATYERAARLSTAVSERVRRLGSSASAATRAGDIVAAVRLCAEAVADVTDPTVLAELCWIQFCLAIASERCQRSAASMVAIAAETPKTSMKLLVLACAALQSHLFGGEPDEMRQAIGAALLELDLEPSHPLRIQTLCIVNPARYGGQFTPMIAKFAEHASELHGLDGTEDWGIAVRGGASRTTGIGTAADSLHLAGESRTIYAAAARLAADIGDLHNLCIGLKNSANRMITAGELDDALATAGQARMSADRGFSLVSAGAAAVQARIFAWRGDRGGVQRCLDDIHDAGACSRADNAALRLWAEGLLALGEGKFGDALELLLGMGVFPQWAMEATGDLVEAAAHLPDGRDRVTAHLDAAVAHAAALNSPLLSEVVSRSQGQLAAGQLAESHFERALRETDPSCWRSERARTQLAYGEWLSAHGDCGRAGEQLAAAARTFAAMGATPWEDRARTGLLATGSVQAKGPARITSKLSDQEWQVARLVAMGKSNKEIADLLFLSHRTVGAHLYRIFPKLDVRSRTELTARVLADGSEHEMGGGF